MLYCIYKVRKRGRLEKHMVYNDTHFRHEAILGFKDYAGKTVRSLHPVDEMDPMHDR